MGKKLNTNIKVVEARNRKEEKKKLENQKKEKEKEDAYWADDDKLINRKINRKEDKEKKRLEEIEKKKMNKKLYEEELQSLKGAKPQVQKVTRAQIEKTLEKQNTGEIISKDLVNNTSINEKEIELNLNRIQVEGEVATDIDAAISILSINDEKIDKNLQKRLKAAYNLFKETNLPLLKQENPNLRLSQIKQLLRKDWMKSPDNPLNKIYKSYNSK